MDYVYHFRYNAEPDHIPRPAEMLAASEIFYDNQSLLVYGEIGVGKTYFVKRLLNIYLDVMPDSPRKITLWIDFNNFSSSLLEICTKLGISCEGRRTYDLVITLINSQPDFVVLDGFSLAHKACGKYFAYCQKFQKEYYYKLIVITEDKEECADFDLAIQIEPFDADQALKFVPQASTFPHEIIEYCDGNAALLNIFRRLVHDGKLNESDRMWMTQNFKTHLRTSELINDVNPNFQGERL